MSIWQCRESSIEAMTAIATRPIRDGSADRADAAAGDALLRFALRADATLCGVLGLLVVMASDPLSRLAGLSATAEWIGGTALVGYGALLFGLAGLRDVRRVGFGVLGGNTAFAVSVAVVLIAGWLPLTEFGTAATIAFTAATVVFAYAQYLGVRRLGAALP
ncbi:membrane protein [Mycobacterium holsaticum DSM 44478]|nr:membrane protein [Mycolicibacterium holsaticum DSM 44478 = JCM 12374]